MGQDGKVGKEILKGRPPVPRYLVKMSGEVLRGDNSTGIVHGVTILKIAKILKKMSQSGIETVVVVGGGNIARGGELLEQGIRQMAGDAAGMLSTCVNAMLLEDVLEQLGQPARTTTAFEMKQMAEPYIRKRVDRHLQKGRVVILGGGIGQPLHSTDFAAVQRAKELNCRRVIMAKNGVDAVYTKDPNRFKDAQRIDQINCQRFLSKGLEVCDATAITFCRTHKLEVQVVGINDPRNILRAAKGQEIGTLITPK